MKLVRMTTSDNVTREILFFLKKKIAGTNAQEMVANVIRLNENAKGEVKTYIQSTTNPPIIATTGPNMMPKIMSGISKNETLKIPLSRLRKDFKTMLMAINIAALLSVLVVKILRLFFNKKTS